MYCFFLQLSFLSKVDKLLRLWLKARHQHVQHVHARLQLFIAFLFTFLSYYMHLSLFVSLQTPFFLFILYYPRKKYYSSNHSSYMVLKFCKKVQALKNSIFKLMGRQYTQWNKNSTLQEILTLKSKWTFIVTVNCDVSDCFQYKFNW